VPAEGVLQEGVALMRGGGGWTLRTLILYVGVAGLSLCCHTWGHHIGCLVLHSGSTLQDHSGCKGVGHVLVVLLRSALDLGQRVPPLPSPSAPV
jgi:hypothetical protein